MTSICLLPTYGGKVISPKINFGECGLRLGKTQINLVLLSTCSNVAPCGREVTRRLGRKNENFVFHFVLLSTCSNVAPCGREVTRRLGKTQINLVLLSTCSNFVGKLRL